MSARFLFEAKSNHLGSTISWITSLVLYPPQWNMTASPAIPFSSVTSSLTASETAIIKLDKKIHAKNSNWGILFFCYCHQNLLNCLHSHPHVMNPFNFNMKLHLETFLDTSLNPSKPTSFFSQRKRFLLTTLV